MLQMISYEQDPDVVWWGLQLFESDPYSNYVHFNSIAQDNVDCCEGQCFERGIYDSKSFTLENDELVARALQEHLSQLGLEEEPDMHEDWLDPFMGKHGSGQEGGSEETDDVGPFSSCSSPLENPYHGEEWLYSLEATNKYAFDGEVGKWLNEMVSIPHVPRINGEIPSVDEATLDHQRLIDRLQVYDLVERKVEGDGNCQFRALSDQFYRTSEHHEFVRQQVVNQLKFYPEAYEGCVPMPYKNYLEKTSMSGEWGDHVTLQAAADSYGVKIIVITSFKDTCYIEILPNVQRSNRVILLSFWAEVHYNSIFPRGDVSAYETKKKKKRRMPRTKLLELPDEEEQGANE